MIVAACMEMPVPQKVSCGEASAMSVSFVAVRKSLRSSF